MKGEHPIRMLCELLKISHSGYYRWCQHRPSLRQRQDAALATKVAAAHQASRGTYGAPRILVDLQEGGTRTSKRRCARLMREQGLQGRKKHRRRPRTTDSRHAQPVAANIIALRPAPTGPNQCWLTDITCIETAQGWLYLAAILDLWSRKIVGWSCGATMHTSLVLAALNDAAAAVCMTHLADCPNPCPSAYTPQTQLGAYNCGARLESAGLLQKTEIWNCACTSQPG